MVKPITTQNFDEVKGVGDIVYRLHLDNLDPTLWAITFRILTNDFIIFLVQDHSPFVMKKWDNEYYT